MDLSELYPQGEYKTSKKSVFMNIGMILDATFPPDPRVENEAINEVRKLIEKSFGKDFLPEAPRFYASKKAVQDAHEAIRPTNLHHTPESIEKYLNQYFCH